MQVFQTKLVEKELLMLVLWVKIPGELQEQEKIGWIVWTWSGSTLLMRVAQAWEEDVAIWWAATLYSFSVSLSLFSSPTSSFHILTSFRVRSPKRFIVVDTQWLYNDLRERKYVFVGLPFTNSATQPIQRVPFVLRTQLVLRSEVVGNYLSRWEPVCSDTEEWGEGRRERFKWREKVLTSSRHIRVYGPSGQRKAFQNDLNRR